MGWSSMHRTQPVKDWFASEIVGGYTLLEAKIVHRTQLYAAIQRKDGSVYCLVALLRYSKGEWNFSYKFMSEFDHPYYYKCPQSILNKLTPTDDKNANEWREACKQNKANGTKRSRLLN